MRVLGLEVSHSPPVPLPPPQHLTTVYFHSVEIIIKLLHDTTVHPFVVLNDKLSLLWLSLNPLANRETVGVCACSFIIQSLLSFVCVIL